MRKFLVLTLAVVLASTLLASTCLAMTSDLVLWAGPQDKPVTNAAAYNPTQADIKIDDTVFFSILTPAAGYTVAQREVLVLKRLTEIYSRSKITPVCVRVVRGKPTIYVDTVRLITVYPRDAVAAKAHCPMMLAQQWAEGIRKGLVKTAPSHCVSPAVLQAEAAAAEKAPHK